MIKGWSEGILYKRTDQMSALLVFYNCCVVVALFVVLVIPFVSSFGYVLLGTIHVVFSKQVLAEFKSLQTITTKLNTNNTKRLRPQLRNRLLNLVMTVFVAFAFLRFLVVIIAFRGQYGRHRHINSVFDTAKNRALEFRPSPMSFHSRFVQPYQIPKKKENGISTGLKAATSQRMWFLSRTCGNCLCPSKDGKLQH